MNPDADLDLILGLGGIATQDGLAVAGTLNGQPISGIYTISSAPDFDLGESGVEQRQIEFLVQTADCPGVAHGDTVIVKGQTHRVHSTEPTTDGSLTNLILIK